MSGALIDFGPDTSNGGPAAPSPDDDAERIARERVEGSVHSPHGAQGQHAHKTGTGSTSTSLLGPLAEEDPLWMETDGLPGMGDTSDGSAGSGSDSGAVSALRALQEGPSGHTMDARRSSHASLLSSAASYVPRPAPLLLLFLSPLPLLLFLLTSIVYTRFVRRLRCGTTSHMCAHCWWPCGRDPSIPRVNLRDRLHSKYSLTFPTLKCTHARTHACHRAVR
jgi:hypothetical protein